jgi:hypothetical protein
MNKGILIYAHNSRSIDYLDLAIISANLAKKNLKVPVSLITDKETINWANKSGKINEVEKIFENIILSSNFSTEQYRRLFDGINHFDDIPFLNKDRCSAWDLTPYERTLLIDSDFLIFSQEFNNYWNLDSDFLMSKGAIDFFHESRFEYNDRYISEVGIPMRWATTIMFTKNENSKIVFDLVSYIKEHYFYFADLFRFDNRIYRNDIAFSIAQHILDGYKTTDKLFLPPIKSSIDKDLLIDVKGNNLFFLISSKLNGDYTFCSKKNQDIHIMNKQSIIRNKSKLMEL